MSKHASHAMSLTNRQEEYGKWIYPDGPDVWFIGDTKTIEFEVEFVTFTVLLYQLEVSTGNVWVDTSVVVHQTSRQQQEFTWVVQVYKDMDLTESDTFFFWLFNGTDANERHNDQYPHLKSPSFRIREKEESSSSNSALPTSTSSSLIAATSSSLIATGTPSSSASATPSPSASAAANTSSGGGGSNSTTIGVGVGVGVGLALILGLLAWYFLWFRKKRQQNIAPEVAEEDVQQQYLPDTKAAVVVVPSPEQGAWVPGGWTVQGAEAGKVDGSLPGGPVELGQGYRPTAGGPVEIGDGRAPGGPAELGTGYHR